MLKQIFKRFMEARNMSKYKIENGRIVNKEDEENKVAEKKVVEQQAVDENIVEQNTPQEDLTVNRIEELNPVQQAYTQQQYQQPEQQREVTPDDLFTLVIKFVNGESLPLRVLNDNAEDVINAIIQGIETKSTVSLGAHIINCEHILSIVTPDNE